MSQRSHTDTLYKAMIFFGKFDYLTGHDIGQRGVVAGLEMMGSIYFLQGNAKEEPDDALLSMMGIGGGDKAHEAEEKLRNVEAFAGANTAFDVQVYGPETTFPGEPLHFNGEPLAWFGKKVILLISGTPSIEKLPYHIRDRNGKDRLVMLPVTQDGNPAEKLLEGLGAGNEAVKPFVNGSFKVTPGDQMRAAHEKLIETYSSSAFRDDGWRLRFLRASDRRQIDGALDYLKKYKPLQLVVHYFGHGASEFYLDGDYDTGDDPYLSRSEYANTFVTVNGTRLPLALPTEIAEPHSTALSKVRQLSEQLKSAKATDKSDLQ